MNKTNLLSKIIFVFALLILVSCDNEPVDPVLANQLNNPTNTGGGGNNNGGGSNNGGGNSGGGTSTGDYFPSALNNEWTYSLDGVAQSPVKMISVDNINGVTYYTFNSQSGSSSTSSVSATQRLRKNSGDYYIKQEEATITAGGINGVQSAFEKIILKDYLTVGQTWTDSYTQTTTYDNPLLPVISMTDNYSGTVLEVGGTITVGATTYTDVIKVRVHDAIQSMGTLNELDTDYWYAKNVGPVKIIYNVTTPNPNISLLTTYTLH